MHHLETDPDEAKAEFSKSFAKKLELGDHPAGNVTNMLNDEDDDDDDESTLAGCNTMMQNDGDLWKTAWSQGRGVLNCDRGSYVDEEPDASLPSTDLSTLRQRRSRV